MNIADFLWLWGQDAGTHHEAVDKNGNMLWKLPGINRMTPCEGAEFFGIINMCRVTMLNKPEPPFDNEMEKLSRCKKVAWSIIGDEGSKRTNGGKSDIDEVLRLAAKYRNVTGGIMDDFFTPERRAVYTPSVLRGFADRLHGAGLDLWTVIYEHQLDLPVDDQLKECDIVSFWTWRAENLSRLEENMSRLESKISKKQKIYAGCYMWDYGGKDIMPLETMEYQLEVYKKWLFDGRIEGIVLCSNCIADIGLEAVDFTKQWIEQNKEI